MKKYRLEDIKRSQVFTKPPQGYFDKLPGVIQGKTAHNTPSNTRRYWLGVVRLVPVAAAIALIIFYTGVFKTSSSGSVDELLSEVSTEDIIDYLATVDLTTEEIMEEIDLTELPIELHGEQDGHLLQELDDASLIELYGDMEDYESLL